MPLFSQYADPRILASIAKELWFGWGYNQFSNVNLARQDSLLIRSKTSTLIGQAREQIGKAESAYRQEFLPPPSRQNPSPDEKAVAGARTITAINTLLGSIEGKIRSAPAPESDRISKRFRSEISLLTNLIIADQKVVGMVELFRRSVQNCTGQWIIDNSTEINDALRQISDAVEERSNLLTIA